MVDRMDYLLSATTYIHSNNNQVTQNSTRFETKLLP